MPKTRQTCLEPLLLLLMIVTVSGGGCRHLGPFLRVGRRRWVLR
jgi:hypothetical protein